MKAEEKFLKEIQDPNIYTAMALVDILTVITARLAIAEFRHEECELGRRDKYAVLHEIIQRMKYSNIV